MTVEKTTGLFIVPSMVEIRGTDIELNLSKTRVQCGVRVKVMSSSGNIQRDLHVFKYNYQGHVPTSIQGRVPTSIKGHIQTSIEGRVPTSTEGRVLTSTRVVSSLKFASEEDQHDSRVFIK